MLCPFGPAEYRHAGRSPYLRQGVTPQRRISCTNETGDASHPMSWHNYCVFSVKYEGRNRYGQIALPATLEAG